MSATFQEKIKQSVDFIKSQTTIVPSILIVLGSGMSELVSCVKDAVSIPYQEIPNFAKATAEGHAGRLVIGYLQERPVAVMQGRLHYYEGYSMEAITLPVHVIHTIGAKTLIVTNAVGGINTALVAGDIVMITDHINMMGVNPLIGISVQTPRNQFPDMTNAYDKKLQNIAFSVAEEVGIDLKSGVYIALSGPSYETKSEIKVFRQWGADIVGMSLVPEVIVANYHKMQVLGLSCVANPAADLHPGGMHHGEVLRTVQEAQPKLAKLIMGVVARL